MFTGLIEATGRIESVHATPEGRRLRIAAPFASELAPGESVSVNGVCLTAIDLDATSFAVDVSPATLRVTSFRNAAAGRRVNLERSLRPDGRLGGHFVQGHVDAVSGVKTVRVEGDHHWIEIGLPRGLERNAIAKGSIAVDGVSLTIAALSDDRFGVQIVPFTWAHTTLSDLAAGDEVNLEMDMIGKYVLRSLEAPRAEITIGPSPLDDAGVGPVLD